MKKVFIDNKRMVVEVNGKRIPRLLLSCTRGAVGKSFVVKRYKGGKIVITRYPDMSGIEASAKQRARRDLFREAVVYAQWIIGDEERKKAFRKTLPRKKQKHVYQAAIQLYMSMKGDQQWLRKQLAVKAMLSIRGEGRLVREQEEKATGNKQLEVKAGEWLQGRRKDDQRVPYGGANGGMVIEHGGGHQGMGYTLKWMVWRKEERRWEEFCCSGG